MHGGPDFDRHVRGAVDQAVCGAAFDILEDRVWTVLLAVFLSVLCAKRAFRGLEGSE